MMINTFLVFFIFIFGNFDDFFAFQKTLNNLFVLVSFKCFDFCHLSIVIKDLVYLNAENFQALMSLFSLYIAFFLQWFLPE